MTIFFNFAEKPLAFRSPTIRKSSASTEAVTEQQQQRNKEHTKVTRAPKRSKVSKPESEPEFFEEQRDMEDLWKQAFPVGTEWHQLDLLSEYKWNFSNLEKYMQQSHLTREDTILSFHDQPKGICIPVVVAVVSPFPPSDKIGIQSVYRESEEILDMKQMKMDWVPYIPLGKRGSSVERLKYQIFILSCVQRRSSLKHLKLDRVLKFQYCLPYFNDPFKEDENETRITSVDINYPMEPKPSPYINRYYGKTYQVY
ncbi:unnamed protein product [Lactuca virosa]|uniref:Uncharacterized protein n=1 Tax=Lactuca virosa TaxID=75947 RepID=A0AAU9M7K7_9ASTR|nr:unnamed protein product [Lactuca virosa]